MKVEVLYDKYNNKIEKAKLIFGDEPIDQQFIELQVSENITEIGEEDIEQIITKVVKFKSIDTNNAEVENELNKEDLRVFLTLLRNLLNQL